MGETSIVPYFYSKPIAVYWAPSLARLYAYTVFAALFFSAMQILYRLAS